MNNDQLSYGFQLLKKNVSEWVITLDTKQDDINERVKEIERRIKLLESKTVR